MTKADLLKEATLKPKESESRVGGEAGSGEVGTGKNLEERG